MGWMCWFSVVCGRSLVVEEAATDVVGDVTGNLEKGRGTGSAEGAEGQEWARCRRLRSGSDAHRTVTHCIRPSEGHILGNSDLYGSIAGRRATCEFREG